MTRRLLAAVVAAALLASCSLAGSTDESTDTTDDLGDPGECAVVDMAVSSEKVSLLTELAGVFNESESAQVGDDCVFVRPFNKASGAATTLLAEGWPDAELNGPQPVVWSPASSAWGAILNQRLADRGQPPMVGDFQPFMLTPLVIAMPRPMAEALGWPDTPLGWADILELARSGGGWGDFGHPEWGAFRLGKTNPNFSTSGLSALIAQTYAATGTTSGLSLEDLASASVAEFNEGVESAVVHYGDITQTFLNNLYRADQRGSGLSYVSAVAVEEKSVVDYNTGNPDGVLDPGEEPRPPRVPLVAIYPEEGTLFSDNPYIVLDAPWVDDVEREGAERFGEFVQEPDNQRKVLEFGFRPGNPEVALGEPITAANGLDPAQPQTTLEIPEPPVMIGILDRWEDQRKKARVLLLIDISGSMGDPAAPGDPGGPTKLDLAKEAAVEAMELFNPEDEIGLRVFSTNLGDGQDQEFLDLVPIGPAGEQRESVQTRIRSLFPTNATPLYTAVQSAYETSLEGFDPARINAVVVLSDGRNDDGTTSDDDAQLETLLGALRAGTEGQATRPVRVFPIAYGTDADQTALRRIAEASNSAVYTATDATTIGRVFTAVISNF